MARLNSSWAPPELWGHLSSQPQEKCKGSRPAPTGRRKFRWSCHRAHDPVHLGAHSRIAGWEPEDRGLPTGGQVEDTAFILVTSESGRLRALRLCAPGAPNLPAPEIRRATTAREPASPGSTDFPVPSYRGDMSLPVRAPAVPALPDPRASS